MKSQPPFPLLLAANPHGDIFELPGLYMAGMTQGSPVLPDKKDLIEMPRGSDLFRLPGRIPVGYDPHEGCFVEVPEYNGEPIEAVGAFMAPAYLQILHSAYVKRSGAPRLPLYCYTAAGWHDDRMYTAGMRIDPDQRQDYKHIDLCLIDKKATAMLQRFPRNRLVEHLVENCVRRYGCPAARNFVMGRWECPVPVSRACNCKCLGCISLQPSLSGFKAPHDRIGFVPSAQEIVEFVVPHLESAQRAVASFGQGCEGEPLLESRLLEEAIVGIRKKTSRGIINLNTNGSLPDAIERLCAAGLDSIRVSCSSAQKRFYNAYYRPQTYAFEDVMESLRIMRRNHRWASINYLMFPGFTDTPTEMVALGLLIKDTRITMIQTRNLNIDPEWYWTEAKLGSAKESGIGMRNWVAKIKSKYPQLLLGYFNPPLSVMRAAMRR